jgi:hypothetical protein
MHCHTQPPVSLRQRATFLLILCFIFALYEGENETQKEDEAPLRMIASGR